MLGSPLVKKKTPQRQPRKRKRRPRKNRKQPGLRRIKRVHAIDVALDVPRQPARPHRSPQQRSRQHNCRANPERRDRRCPPVLANPPQHRHQHQRNADRVQNVHAQQIGPHSQSCNPSRIPAAATNTPVPQFPGRATPVAAPPDSASRLSTSSGRLPAPAKPPPKTKKSARRSFR